MFWNHYDAEELRRKILNERKAGRRDKVFLNISFLKILWHRVWISLKSWYFSTSFPRTTWSTPIQNSLMIPPSQTSTKRTFICWQDTFLGNFLNPLHDVYEFLMLAADPDGNWSTTLQMNSTSLESRRIRQ